MSRLHRLVAIIGLGTKRVLARLTGSNSRRLRLSVSGVGLAIGLMVLVSAVSLGLGAQATVYGSGVDYWIVPESASASTMAVSVQGPQFGAVHPVSERVSGMSGVQSATPVNIEVLPVSHANTTEYVMFIGVIAKQGVSVAGVNASSLSAGDPYYANGTYDGQWTGEMVVSSGTAKLLNLSRGESITLQDRSANASVATRQFTVLRIDRSGGQTALGSLPIAVVHLAELQEITGGTSADVADQILVQTSNRGVRSQLEHVYPHSRVVTKGASISGVSTSDMAIAMGLSSFLVALIVGTLFVATTMGLEITADRRHYATLAALGFSSRSRRRLVIVQTLIVTLLGGILGVAIGLGGLRITNHLARTRFDIPQLAIFHPGLIPYGIAVAGLVGLLATPYLLWLVGRTSLRERLTR